MNRTDLAALLGQEWQQPHCRARFAGIGELYVTHGAECHKLVAGEEGIFCSWVDELCTQQEKADIRILLHAGHASSSGHDCIIIKSPDTDAVHSVTESMSGCSSVPVQSSDRHTSTSPLSDSH